MDAEGMEKRRMEGLRLLRQGLNQNQVATRLGVTRGAVNHWVKAYENGGKKALKAKPRPGAPRKLTEDQLRHLRKALVKGADAHGFPNDLWTCPRVARVIEERLGVTYHPGHVWRILHDDLGWTWQKPVRRATERDEAEVRRWTAEEWPQIEKKGVPRGRR